MFFNRKKTEITLEPGTLGAITSGRTVLMENVKDDVFAQKILGDGIAFYSEDGVVCAPCDGTVGMLAETAHAIGLSAEDGQDIIIHIGVNTAAEGGRGFKTFVKAGDRVRAGQKLVSFDTKALGAKGYDLIIPLILSDSDSLKSLKNCGEKTVSVGEVVLRYEK